jgi:hypothetical protein
MADEISPEQKAAYEQLSVQVPERDIEIEGVEGHARLTDKMKEENVSDIRSLQEQLFPKLDFDPLNKLQMAEIFPDAFCPMERLMIKGYIKKLRSENKEVSLSQVIAEVRTAVSMALDRASRIDALRLGGAVKEMEDKKAENQLGGLLK